MLEEALYNKNYEESYMKSEKDDNFDGDELNLFE